jgi:hypothetical protein
LRAGRKAGQLDKRREKAKPGPRPEIGSSAEPNSGPPTLRDLGVSKRQAHDRRKLADVPQDQFEAARPKLPRWDYYFSA